MKFKKLFLKLVATLIFMLCGLPAMAGLILTIDDLGTTGIDIIVVDDVDGGVGTSTSKGLSTFADTSAGDGLISFLGGFLNITTGLSNPYIGDANTASLNLIALFASASTGKLEIMLTDTDYILGEAGSLLNIESLLGGTTSSAFTAEQFIDFNNNEFGMDTTIGGVRNFNSVAFSDSKSLQAINSSGGLFSITHRVTIDFSEGVNLTSFDMQGNVTLANTVPEPATLVLMGLGLAGIGYRRRNAT